MSNENERQRLSLLCKKLRGDESLRSFTKKRSKELGGIGFTTWGAWERGQADLSKDSLERLVNFIGCSFEAISGYLSGYVALEELFESSVTEVKLDKKADFSPDTASAWVKSLAPQDKLFIAAQGLQAFQQEFDKFVEAKTKERTEFLFKLLSNSSYPDDSQIEAAAEKLDVSVDELRKLCDRVYLK
ncbi:MAG: hypothetical protein AAF378_14930 [Cyanobacteria bacterium P01_A01_bin.84]